LGPFVVEVTFDESHHVRFSTRATSQVDQQHIGVGDQRHGRGCDVSGDPGRVELADLDQPDVAGQPLSSDESVAGRSGFLGVTT